MTMIIACKSGCDNARTHARTRMHAHARMHVTCVQQGLADACMCYHPVQVFNSAMQLIAAHMHAHRSLLFFPMVQALWAEFTQDNVADNNATRQYCTEALSIHAPYERTSDR